MASCFLYKRRAFITLVGGAAAACRQLVRPHSFLSRLIGCRLAG